MTENEIGRLIVDSAIRIHREIGPGLLESIYEIVLARELTNAGLVAKRQVPIPIKYQNMYFEEGFRADILINEKVIVEIKCVRSISAAHKKQLLTYLRLTNTKLGFLLNFSEAMMKDGIKRIVNHLS